MQTAALTLRIASGTDFERRARHKIKSVIAATAANKKLTGKKHAEKIHKNKKTQSGKIVRKYKECRKHAINFQK
ncbi:MAG: hypothetical protein EOM63_01670 [Clostridia bacterium]|nr:hypothetical protein [Clostridia bacterium]